MKLKYAFLTLFLLFTPRSPAKAAPAYDLEGLLKRAEIVYVGRVSELALEKQPAILSTGKSGSSISDRKIQLEIVEILRGSKGDIKGNYGLLGLGDRPEIRPGAFFLVLSQGDNYWGTPEPVMSFHQLTKGQASYCGWLMYPLSNTGEDEVVASLHSSKSENNGPLTLIRVKEAVGETRYDPDLYGKRRR
jgi:hypothetical protein